MLHNSEKLERLKDHRVILFIFFISLALRLCLRSNYADDWDSVQFILALKHFSILAHQPHPPGYPVYVFLGRIFDYFFNDGLKSLTTMSAFFGALSLIPTYLLAKKLFNKNIGIISAIILSLAPAQLLFSEVAMSDIVGMSFIAITAYLLYRGLDSRMCLFIGSTLLGITMGVRQTDFLIISIFLIVHIYKKCIIDFILSSTLALIGVVSWLIPTIMATGLDDFIRIFSEQGKAAVGMGTLYSLGGPSLPNLSITLKTLFYLFADGWSNAFFVFILIALAAIFYNTSDLRKNLGDIRSVLMLGWLVPYLALFITITDLSTPRYLLPAFPPMAIIFGYSIIKITNAREFKYVRKILIIVTLAAIIFMGYQAISNAYELHVTKPAPVDAANFIRDRFDPNTTVLVSWGSFRHFQYYLPGFEIILYDHSKPIDLTNYLEQNKTIICEGDPIVDSYDSFEFGREHKIYPKHESVKLYMASENFKPRYFILKGSGWNDPENWTGAPTRWLQGDAIIFINSCENRTVSLSLSATSFYRPRTLEIYSNNRMLARAPIAATGFSQVSAQIPLLKGANNSICFHVPDGCERPTDKPSLGNPDSRCFSVAMKSIRIN